MSSYRDLEIFKLSYALAIRVHQLSRTLPKYEQFEEGSQIRRSSKGITSTIVEGYGRKRYKADFIRFLTYSHASCDETIAHLNFIKDTHGETIDMLSIKDLLDGYATLGKKINKFTAYVDREWK